MLQKIDFSLIEKYESLQTIVKLREIIRKLWKLEISFMDDKGFVVDHARGRVIPPENEFCKTCLFCDKGLDLCDRSVVHLGEKVRTGDYPRGGIFDGLCHLGLKMLAIPYYSDGKYIGSIFSCSFVTKELTDSQIEEINRRMKPINGGFDEPKDLAGLIPVINEGSLEYLLELIRFGMNELESFRKEMGQKDKEIFDLNKQLQERYSFDSIIGKSPVMQNLYELIEKISDSESSVLITGENGSGKKLVAKTLHYNSGRKAKRFIIQNCSSLSDNLLDSELFGHVKGAFPGSSVSKRGLCEVANGGTILLEEIADMSQAMQVKVLRVLQEGTFIPVGGTDPKKVDVRVIATTDKDLRKMVDRREFREDLYYKINVLNITVPPLRERRDDVSLLMDHFIKKNSGRLKKKNCKVSPDAMEALMNYHWPGNVRQLENEIERVIVLSGKDEIITKDLLSKEVTSGAIITSDVDLKGSLREAIRTVEKRMILEGLRRHNWNKSKLARELGVSRASLIMKVAEYGFEREDCNA